jgi:hypothetical protein
LILAWRPSIKRVAYRHIAAIVELVERNQVDPFRFLGTGLQRIPIVVAALESAKSTKGEL